VATMTELTALGDCPTCGRPRWVEATCRCGHMVLVHDFGTSKGATVRTKCTVTDATGPCPCERFTEEASDG